MTHEKEIWITQVHEQTLATLKYAQDNNKAITDGVCLIALMRTIDALVKLNPDKEDRGFLYDKVIGWLKTSQEAAS